MANIALTFDNGPDPVATPKILDTLDRRGISSFFFVIGSKAATPDGAALMRDAHSAGHRIGNHTWSHTTPLGEMVDAAESIDEIARTETALGAVADPQKLFRPFGRRGARGPHLLSKASFRYLIAEQYTCVLWNCVPRDWNDDNGWVDRAMTQIDSQASPLLVLHDIAGAAARRLDDFLVAALGAGHCFVTDVPDSEIIIDRGIPRQNATNCIAGAQSATHGTINEMPGSI